MAVYRRRRRQRKYRPRRYRRRAAKLSKYTPVTTTLRAHYALMSTAGGIIQDTVTDSPSGYPEFASFVELYDFYRVYAVSIKFIPDKPNDPSVTTVYKPLYCVMDADNTANPADIDDMVEYRNLKVFNMYKPWTAYFKFPKYTGDNNPQAVIAGGWANTNNPSAHGGVHFYGTDYDVSDNYGHFIVTLYIRFKTRR